MNLRPFIRQMWATFPGVEFLRELSRTENYCRISTSSIKRRIWRFHVVVVQWTSKKCTKKRDARAELLFWFLRKQIHNLLLLDLLKQDSYADIDFLINEIKKRMILIQCIATFIFLLLYIFIHWYYYLF